MCRLRCPLSSCTKSQSGAFICRCCLQHQLMPCQSQQDCAISTCGLLRLMGIIKPGRINLTDGLLARGFANCNQNSYCVLSTHHAHIPFPRRRGCMQDCDVTAQHPSKSKVVCTQEALPLQWMTYLNRAVQVLQRLTPVVATIGPSVSLTTCPFPFHLPISPCCISAL